MRWLTFLIVAVGMGMILIACSNSESSSQNETASKEAVDSADSGDSSPSTKNILFFGNSLTAGYGLEDLSDAFPGLIQDKIDDKGLEYTVINAGLSGETTATGKNRVEWLLRQPVDIFVLELGANDGLRGIDTEETRRNLQAIIDIVKSKYPEVKIVLMGMMVPPNMGPDYSAKFQVIFKELAILNQTAFVPFLLEGVAGEPDLNLPDGIHPTEEGHKIVAENVWKVLEGLL